MDIIEPFTLLEEDILCRPARAEGARSTGRLL